MMKFYLPCALLFLVVTLFAQTRERVVSGQLKSNEDGSPLPAVNIIIKGTTRGTVTDAEGRYSLSVPIGSVLVFSFIGMQTREVLVTETALQSVNGDVPIRVKSPKGNWNPSILKDTLGRDVDGAATLRSNASTYQLRSSRLIPNDIVSIRRPLLKNLWSGREFFVVNTNNDQYAPKGLRVQFNTAIGFNVRGRLPQLQSSFAQGRNDNGTTSWRGPDQHEVMSWGPAVKTLEYKGDAYPYDRSGGITTAGTGNGKSVNTYDPYKFLRTGATQADELTVWFPGISRSTTNVDGSRKRNLGIVPNNDFTAYNISMNMKKIGFSQRLKADVSVLFNSADGRLMTRGANISNIIGSMMLTAPTFDATNGYGRKTVFDNPAAFRLPDGTVRSSAPGIIDNPYGLIATLPDREKSQRLLSSLGFTYDRDKLDINLNGTVDRQNSNIVYGVQQGFSPYLPGRRTERDETREDMAINLLGTYKAEKRQQFTTLSFGYQFRQERRSVSRADGFGYTNETFGSIGSADSLSTFDFSLTRNIHEISTKVQYEYQGFDMQLGNRSYFSNTAKLNYVNLFPSLIVKADLVRTFYIDFLSELKPFASISRTIRESPAIFGNQAVLSTQLNSQQYNQYFENREIVWNKQLRPETELKSEIGIRATTYFNLTMDYSYYNNTTFDLILPVLDQGHPVLNNAAVINNTGHNVAISYANWQYYNGRTSWGASLRWTKYNSVVTSIDVPAPYLPLGGFNNIQTVVAKGEPLGAIYGTRWLRDEEGRQIIGNDGFPLVDNQLRKIGNPIPLYLISLEPYINLWRNLKLSFILDFKKDGQVWNGTKAALDYSGRSENTADQRNTSQYIFDGVTTNGIVNATPVDFYDPALPLQQNRWVRYGFSGVGEEYIEDASWIRLNEAALSYRFYPIIGGTRKEFVARFVGKNLFLVTPYSGVDPGTSLYGYSNGTGLDLFNAPSLKSYTFSLTIKL